MQTEAIFEAAVHLIEEGKEVRPEIMVPLIGTVRELEIQKDIIEEIAKEVMDRSSVHVDYLVGTMIEVPRAALTADEIARVAQFFSFGTNDLTQTTLGISRDDAGAFLTRYIETNIIPFDPFQSIDRAGVGELMRIGVTKGRETRPNLKVGICGEHGGDPRSVEFCHQLGLDYVSCSPFRVPIARLSAARAAIMQA